MAAEADCVQLERKLSMRYATTSVCQDYFPQVKENVRGESKREL